MIARLRARLHRLALHVYARLPQLVRRWLVRAMAPSYTAGAMCLVQRPDGRILLIEQVYRRQWGMPGGLLARREAPEAAAVREVREETGLAVELLGEPATVLDPPKQRIDLIFRARPAAGADLGAVAPMSPEIERLAWFALDDLPPLQTETAQALVALARSAAHPQTDPLAPWPGLLSSIEDG